MYGSVLSALLLGMLPVWGIAHSPVPVAPPMAVSPPSVPALQASLLAARPVLEALSASGVLVMDMESGQRLFSRDVDVPRPMASLTKQMTALLVVEREGGSLDRWITVPQSVRSIDGTVASLIPGEQYTVGDLLGVMLVGSANDAATTLAENYSGSTEEFVDVMNRRAQELGLRDTHFANPAGLDAPGQQSTPQDLAWLAMFAMRYPQIRDRMGMRSIEIHSSNGRTIGMQHTHMLLHQDADILAGKTGTTGRAGQCLLSLVSAHGRRYMVVLLGSDERYRDMQIILEALRAS
jgi:D-alanyl-D-alanine carboxypeptidase (penicillin-binding protein 5/6)